MKKSTPLDYINRDGDVLIPVQVRLPSQLVEQVKKKLERGGLTMTDLVKGALLWYLNDANDSQDELKRKTGK